MYDPNQADTRVADLRAALAAHGITRPSLGVDLPACAARCPTRPPMITLELLATPAEVSGVRGALRPHGIDVQLCASELVTTVIRHVGEGVPVTVRVWRDGGRVRLGVTDPDPRALPVLVTVVGSESESGRGLALLDALAVRWGVEQEAGCKTVWCELLVPVPETPERPGRRRRSTGALGQASARS